MRLLSPHEDVFILEDLVTPEHCAAYLKLAHDQGFASAPVTTPRGFVHMPEVRNNERVMLDAPELAAHLYDSCIPHFPAAWQGFIAPTRPGHASWHALGLNERLRFYCYHPGQYFRPHRDGCFRRSPVEQSFLTMLLFLNEGFDGGQTTLFLPSGPLVITPTAGNALFFKHTLLHEGAEVLRGTKYILRSDVMYALEDDDES